MIMTKHFQSLMMSLAFFCPLTTFSASFTDVEPYNVEDDFERFLKILPEIIHDEEEEKAGYPALEKEISEAIRQDNHLIAAFTLDLMAFAYKNKLISLKKFSETFLYLIRGFSLQHNFLFFDKIEGRLPSQEMVENSIFNAEAKSHILVSRYEKEKVLLLAQNYIIFNPDQAAYKMYVFVSLDGFFREFLIEHKLMTREQLKNLFDYLLKNSSREEKSLTDFISEQKNLAAQWVSEFYSSLAHLKLYTSHF